MPCFQPGHGNFRQNLQLARAESQVRHLRVEQFHLCGWRRPRDATHFGREIFHRRGISFIIREHDWIVKQLNLSFPHFQDRWEYIAPLFLPRCGLGMVAMGGELFVLGGENTLSTLGHRSCSIESYKPEENTWVSLRCDLCQRKDFCMTVV